MSQHTKHGCDHIFFIGFLGAGKSTLARLALGLIEPTEGTVRFKNAPIP